VVATGAEAKATKNTINTQRIYPPLTRDRAALPAAAAPGAADAAGPRTPVVHLPKAQDLVTPGGTDATVQIVDNAVAFVDHQRGRSAVEYGLQSASHNDMSCVYCKLFRSL
jgi:hypothetical protein